MPTGVEHDNLGSGSSMFVFCCPADGAISFMVSYCLWWYEMLKHAVQFDHVRDSLGHINPRVLLHDHRETDCTITSCHDFKLESLEIRPDLAHICF